MLLEGDYLRSVEKIMDAFKVMRRMLIAKAELKVCHTDCIFPISVKVYDSFSILIGS